MRCLDVRGLAAAIAKAHSGNQQIADYCIELYKLFPERLVADYPRYFEETKEA